MFREEVAAVSPGVGGDDDEVIFSRGIQKGLVGKGVKADRVKAGPPDPWEILSGRMAGVIGEWSVSH